MISRTVFFNRRYRIGGAEMTILAGDSGEAKYGY
jgi:hypothetical protein